MKDRRRFAIVTTRQFHLPALDEGVYALYRNSKVMWHDPVNTKHLYNICTMLDQRRRRWADVVQMLYKCFVFAGIVVCHGVIITHCWIGITGMDKYKQI